MQKKIAYIISNLDKALAFEWIAENLNKEKYALSFILLNPGNSALEDFFRSRSIPVQRVLFRGKKDLPVAIFRVMKIFWRIKPDVVHAHLFYANIAGLLAAWLCGVRKRIYTRHHSTYHHVYHPGFVKYDRLVNFFSTDIVAISKTVEELLVKREKVNPTKIKLIHHGFMLDDFRNVSSGDIATVRKTYNPGNRHPVIGVISRYTEWKGIQFIIPAFKELLKSFPGALLVLANADGDNKKQIQALLAELPENSFTEIRFESNIFALYKLFDVFVHTPIDKYSEAFGQTYVEALAAGIPSVFTLSGIACEFIQDSKNALVVPYKDSGAILQSIWKLLEDKKLSDHLVEAGKRDVESFRFRFMIESLEELYNA
jgi:glycosyltransferase involved in cell wall biosynthesis